MRSLSYLIGQSVQERYEEDLKDAEARREAGMRLARALRGLDVPKETSVYRLPAGMESWQCGWAVAVPTLEGARALVFGLLEAVGTGKFAKTSTQLVHGYASERVLCYEAEERMGVLGRPTIDVNDEKLNCRRVERTTTYNTWVCDL